MARMRKQQAAAPAGGAGLMRYFDVDTHGPKINPKLLLSVIVTIIVVEIVLSLF